MDNFQALPANRLLFDFASRLGSLEGYLYAEVRNEIQSDYLALLKKVRDLLHKAYGDQDPNTAKIDAVISRIPQ